LIASLGQTAKQWPQSKHIDDGFINGIPPTSLQKTSSAQIETHKPHELHPEASISGNSIYDYLPLLLIPIYAIKHV